MMMELNISKKNIQYNICFFVFFSLIWLCVFYNENIYSEFVKEVVWGWGGSDIKIHKEVDRKNMTDFVLDHYSFNVLKKIAPSRSVSNSAKHNFVMYVFALIAYIVIPLLHYKRRLKRGYFIITDILFFSSIYFCYLLVYKYGNPFAGYLTLWFNIVLLTILLLFRLFQYFRKNSI